MIIAIGQMDPNGFIHINTFQHWCLLAGVDTATWLFWFHYDFRWNPKSNGLYTIAQRAGHSEWCFTYSSNKKSHTHWCYLVGPKLVEFGVWREVKPTKLMMPTSLLEEATRYEKLVKFKLPKVSFTDSRDMDWLFAQWGNGNTMTFFTCFLLLS